MPNDAHRLRLLAEECRTVAETMQSFDLRRRVLEIADSYDRMARAADERATREEPKP
jgi:hypothetical protein